MIRCMNCKGRGTTPTGEWIKNKKDKMVQTRLKCLDCRGVGAL
jgi:hypothetical protein